MPRKVFGSQREGVTGGRRKCIVRILIICTPSTYYQSDEVKEAKMNGICNMHGRDKTFT
jgi:hypothetical protein